MSLSEAVAQLSDYLNNKMTEANSAALAGTNRAAGTPDGAMRSEMQTATSASTMASLSQNPVINTVVDTVNEAATTVAQQVVRDAITKINLTPIQNATQQFFTLFASITTFGTEVAMAFARNTGRNITQAVQDKQRISNELESEIVALYNACAILLNGQPFFDQYLQNVLRAYNLILSADNTLRTVVTALSHPTRPRYHSRRVTDSINRLTEARDLILPDRGADVSSIRATGEFISSVIDRQSNRDVYAAAISIPGITLNIARLVVEYQVKSVELNALINTFAGVLNDYIANYQQSQSLNAATIAHLNAGITQLASLLDEMEAILSQNSNTATDIRFRAKLSSYGIQWGVKLTGTIEWLKANPGAGSALLTQTSDSVAAYNRSVANLGVIGNRTFSGGTVFVTAGKEDAFRGLVPLTARILATANLIVATSQSRASVLTQATAVRRYLQNARVVDSQILTAIQPFMNTRSTLSEVVDRSVNQLIGVANTYGLDRLAGLLTSGNIKDVLSVTPDTATHAGAAVVGMNSILNTLRELPDATVQQVSQIETLRDQVMREQKAQEVYAGRSAQATADADEARRQQDTEDTEKLIETATEAAKQLDAEVAEDPTTKTEEAMGAQVTPGMAPSARDIRAEG